VLKSVTILLTLILLITVSCKKNLNKLIDNSSHKTALNSNYAKANALLQENKLDSSFFYFDLASDEFLEKGDSLNSATCLIQMAITLFLEGDYYGSQETSIEADKLINKQNKDHYALLAYNYNNLGNAISGYGDHDEAIRYYDLAIEFASDSLNTATYSNNKAVTLSYAKKFKEAYTIFDTILNSNFSSQIEYARALSNYANTKWHVDLEYNPLRDLHVALHIRIKENDLYGINASFAHLHHYHLNSNLDSALYYARKSFEVATQLKNVKDKINAADKLVQLSRSDSSKYYFTIYKDLSDSVRIARLKSSNQYAMIRYEAEKSKKENLLLQKEILDKDLKMIRHRSIAIGIVAMFLISFGFFIYRYNKRKKQIKLEATAQIKENKLKTSKKVHDVVANGIYRVMSELENVEDINRNDLLDKLEYMYEKSRDISYESDEADSEKPFSEEISYLLKSFVHDELKLFIIGNEEELWLKISKNNKQEIISVIQELLVNMRKYSRCNELIFRFEENEGALCIHYSDNGVGLPKVLIKGNGLTNTGNRIEKLGGALNFDLERDRGTHILIAVPFS
jgi:two-component sensor histidine kinase/cbb3-type cytochrome oxidase subunit 3